MRVRLLLYFSDGLWFALKEVNDFLVCDWSVTNIFITNNKKMKNVTVENCKKLFK